jgi:hypothetical protein
VTAPHPSKPNDDETRHGSLLSQDDLERTDCSVLFLVAHPVKEREIHDGLAKSRRALEVRAARGAFARRLRVKGKRIDPPRFDTTLFQRRRDFLSAPIDRNDGEIAVVFDVWGGAPNARERVAVARRERPATREDVLAIANDRAEICSFDLAHSRVVADFTVLEVCNATVIRQRTHTRCCFFG